MYRKIAGIALFAILTQIIESDSISIDARCPYFFVEPNQSSVQGILTVVARQRVLVSIEREFAVGDAVAVPPDERAEVWSRLQIAIQIVIAEHDVGEFARPVRHLERDHDPAVICNRSFYLVALEDV